MMMGDEILNLFFQSTNPNWHPVINAEEWKKEIEERLKYNNPLSKEEREGLESLCLYLINYFGKGVIDLK